MGVCGLRDGPYLIDEKPDPLDLVVELIHPVLMVFDTEGDVVSVCAVDAEDDVRGGFELAAGHVVLVQVRGERGRGLGMGSPGRWSWWMWEVVGGGWSFRPVIWVCGVMRWVRGGRLARSCLSGSLLEAVRKGEPVGGLVNHRGARRCSGGRVVRLGLGRCCPAFGP